MVKSREIVERRKLRKQSLMRESSRHRLELWDQCDEFQDRYHGWVRMAAGVVSTGARWAVAAAPWAGVAILSRVSRGTPWVAAALSWFRASRTGQPRLP
jgi:hypothetical protein